MVFFFTFGIDNLYTEAAGASACLPHAEHGIRHPWKTCSGTASDND